MTATGARSAHHHRSRTDEAARAGGGVRFLERPPL